MDEEGHLHDDNEVLLHAEGWRCGHKAGKLRSKVKMISADITTGVFVGWLVGCLMSQ